MSKRKQPKGGRPERQIRVREVRRAQPDTRKLSQALVLLAAAQAETEARRHHELSDIPNRQPASKEITPEQEADDVV
jgi:hypothetical protein